MILVLRDQLIDEYLPLAESLAKQVWNTAPYALELDELRGIAYLGLVQIADRWEAYCAENGHDPAATQYFKVMVVRRVRGAIYDALRRSDWATRLLRSRAKALQEAGQDTGLSETELAERSGLTLDEVRATIRDMAQRRPLSLDAEEVEPFADRDVESSAVTSGILARVVECIRGMSTEERIVIALHYYQGLQLGQVAAATGMAESRVSTLHAEAVLTIHEAMRAAATEEH